MTFTLLDAVFFLMILCFAVTAAVNGFIKELFSKLAVVAGVVCAVYFGALLAPYFKPLVDNSSVDLILSFAVLFIASFLAVKILQIIFSGIFNSEIMGSLNRVLGFVFGFLEGCVIVACLIILLKAQPWFSADSFLEKSTIVQHALPYLASPIEKMSGIFA